MALNSSTFCGKATVFLAVMPTLSSTPFLFRLALHRRRFLVLELEPVRRPSRTVARAEPLRDDPLSAVLIEIIPRALVERHGARAAMIKLAYKLAQRTRSQIANVINQHAPTMMAFNHHVASAQIIVGAKTAA
jgi:hypothetical protein